MTQYYHVDAYETRKGWRWRIYHYFNNSIVYDLASESFFLTEKDAFSEGVAYCKDREIQYLPDNTQKSKSVKSAE